MNTSSSASTQGHFFNQEYEMPMTPPTPVGYASEKLSEIPLFFWTHGISGKLSRHLQIRREATHNWPVVMPGGERFGMKMRRLIP